MDKPAQRSTDTFLILCNLLNKLFDAKILSSYFLHSKLNRPGISCISELWNILHRMAGCNILQCPKPIRCTKRGLKAMNYKSVAFYTLPKDKTSGSQELLLAISWLIAQYQIEDPFSPPTLGPLDGMKYLAYHGSMIRKRMSSVPELYERRCRLLVEIQQYKSTIFGINQLTTNEVHLLYKNKPALRLYLEKLGYVSDVIDAYLLWFKKKPDYFKWMKTVMDQRRESFKTRITTMPRFKNFIITVKKLDNVDPSTSETLPNLYYPWLYFLHQTKFTDCTREFYKNEIERFMSSIQFELEKRGCAIIAAP